MSGARRSEAIPSPAQGTLSSGLILPQNQRSEIAIAAGVDGPARLSDGGSRACVASGLSSGCRPLVRREARNDLPLPPGKVTPIMMQRVGSPLYDV